MRSMFLTLFPGQYPSRAAPSPKRRTAQAVVIILYPSPFKKYFHAFCSRALIRRFASPDSLPPLRVKRRHLALGFVKNEKEMRRMVPYVPRPYPVSPNAALNPSQASGLWGRRLHARPYLPALHPSVAGGTALTFGIPGIMLLIGGSCAERFASIGNGNGPELERIH